MTTEYDELLARPTPAQLVTRLRNDIFDAVPDNNDMQHTLLVIANLIEQQSQQIPEITAQVVELTRDLDTTEGLWKKATQKGREMEAQVVERDAVIEDAPHENGCATNEWDHQDLIGETDEPCDCWKSQAPRDALAAHDKTVRATALRDAAENYSAQQPLGTSASAWLKNRADKEEAKNDG